MEYHELYPGARGFFLVGGDRIERRCRDGESRSGEKKRSALLTLTFLAAGEREDLWHPGYMNYQRNLKHLECMHNFIVNLSG